MEGIEGLSCYTHTFLKKNFVSLALITKNYTSETQF